MKTNRYLIFVIPLFLFTCKPSSANFSTQTFPSPISQTEPPVVIQYSSSIPSPTITLTATSSQTPIPSSTPTLPPSLSSLLVVYTDEKNIWLWQNGVPTLLTTTEGYSEVRPSDDGQRVAFTRNGQLWVINSNGTDERLLVSSNNLKEIEPETSESTLVLHQFDWIPESHALLFNTSFSGYGISHRDDLHLIDADTLEGKTLRDAGEGGIFSFSPSGKLVALVTPHEISIMEINGTNYRSLLKYSQINTGSEYYYYVDPIWSLDSQALVVDIPPRDYKDHSDTALKVIWRLFANGNSPVVLSKLPARYHYIFSPDLSKLAYYNEIRNDGEVHIANIDGSGTTPYQFEPNINFVTWSPNSTSFVLKSRKTNQYFLASVEDEPVVLTEQESQDFLWIDESHFLYKNIFNGTCDLRLGTIDKPSILLVSLNVDPNPYDCFKPYDFVQ